MKRQSSMYCPSASMPWASGESAVRYVVCFSALECNVKKIRLNPLLTDARLPTCVESLWPLV